MYVCMYMSPALCNYTSVCPFPSLVKNLLCTCDTILSNLNFRSKSFSKTPFKRFSTWWVSNVGIALRRLKEVGNLSAKSPGWIFWCCHLLPPPPSSHGSCKPIDEYPNAWRPCRCGDKAGVPAANKTTSCYLLLAHPLNGTHVASTGCGKYSGTSLRWSLCKAATSLKQPAPLVPDSTKALESTSVEQPPLYGGQLELAHRWLSYRQVSLYKCVRVHARMCVCVCVCVVCV